MFSTRALRDKQQARQGGLPISYRASLYLLKILHNHLSLMQFDAETLNPLLLLRLCCSIWMLAKGMLAAAAGSGSFPYSHGFAFITQIGAKCCSLSLSLFLHVCPFLFEPTTRLECAALFSSALHCAHAMTTARSTPPWLLDPKRASHNAMHACMHASFTIINRVTSLSLMPFAGPLHLLSALANSCIHVSSPSRQRKHSTSAPDMQHGLRSWRVRSADRNSLAQSTCNAIRSPRRLTRHNQRLAVMHAAYMHIAQLHICTPHVAVATPVALQS